ncbi:N-formylglutamate amidohydrolase [Sphingobium sp. B2D3A]|uniref:N-formylglutamate amidohydrolase n=1 Tax=unclassified Sphingobium TaxID=2611147 RepID=UPI0022241B6F|nr:MULTISPECIES: N-formylglutamate amidohydrolase [unclassified Sphingobium]MCW2337562.1 N-formylglutamate amidohydrolase [Sphingobium sp. B2D3A]MCW2384020.1 N-formylglutamate amidohydrolase [Sphingobium sp. B2D3D]
MAGDRGPLVFAVPHAGRDYSPALLARARVSQKALQGLEDRYADLLVERLIEQSHHVLIARQPRALIDLNRDEREVDLQGIQGAPWSFRGQSSAKLRGGLGLIPERLAATGGLWRDPLPYAALCQHIEQVHRPYHAALAAALDVTRRRYGIALLLDIHSMPPLKATTTDMPTPRVVIGDRFGRSATDRLTDLCADVIRRHRLPVAINAPYAGNHILERHGRPERDVHAIQIEFDRSLYLDATMAEPGPGLADVQALLVTLAEHLSRELIDFARPLAAE